MDHLPLPQDKFIGHIAIPFLASDDYTSPFHDYPQRNGWNFEFNGNLDPILNHTPTSQANKDLGSLMQTWLYFGLLSEFLGAPVDMKPFQQASESGSMVLSSEVLESLVCNRTSLLLEHSEANGTALVESWRDAFNEVLLVIRHNTCCLVARTAKDDQALSLTCLAISVLAEYTTTALGNLCGRLRVESPVKQKWRISSPDLPLDCGLPIVRLMQQRGWCPHDVALFNGAQIETVSTLWYLANLSPPKMSLSHSACTAEACLPLQMDKSQYHQSHTTRGCTCSSVESDQSTLASIIWSGRIPIVAFRNNEVVMTEQVPGSRFVAISHVWADGKGNPRANSLPSCVMSELQRLVNDLPKEDSTADTPFWIDTLCVPRSPPELKMQALQRLKEPYEGAAGVLVIDSYLNCHSAAQVSPIELLARLSTCGWSQRLWTFQEGRLPNEPARVHFAFKDRTVDLLEELNVRYSHFPTLASHTVLLGLLFGHNQTQMIRLSGVRLPEDYLRSVHVLRESLRTRATSQADDEGLCLGTILRLSRDSMRKITQANDMERMARVWDELPEIPVGIAFSKAPRKLKVKGYRWAPKSFMGSLHLDIKQWEGPNGTWAGPIKTSILPGGLAIRRPGWVLGVGNAWSQKWLLRIYDIEGAANGKMFTLYDPAGRWFNCTAEEAWHDDARKASVGDFFVVILEGGPDFGDAQAFGRDINEFESQGTQRGLLASCRRDPMPGEDEEVVQVIAHRHVCCTMVSKKTHEVRTLLKTCADGIDAVHLERLVEQAEDERGLQELVSNAVKHHLSVSPVTLQLMKSINAWAQWGDDDSLAFDDCVNFVKHLVELGPCYTLRTAFKDRTWCID